MSSLRVFAVNSSPRGNKGNTAKLLNQLLEGIKDAGAETYAVNLFDKDIKYCTGCYTCWFKTPGRCVQQDDMNSLLKDVSESDILVLATPVYVYSMNGLMKTFLDRMLPLALPQTEIHDGFMRHPLRDGVRYSKIALVSTCGQWGLSNFDPLVAHIETLCKYRGKELVAALLRPHAALLFNPLSEDVLKAAREAGYQLVKNGSISRVMLERVSQQLISLEEHVKGMNRWVDFRLKGGS